EEAGEVKRVDHRPEGDGLVRRRVPGDDAGVGLAVPVGVLAGLPALGVPRALRAHGAGDAAGAHRAVLGALGVAEGAALGVAATAAVGLEVDVARFAGRAGDDLAWAHLER